MWMLRLGIRVLQEHLCYPHRQGKEERFHRTLKADVLQQRILANQEAAHRAFHRWRPVYNCERPHAALALNVPVRRYRPSARRHPEQLPEVEFIPVDEVRKVQHGESFTSRGRRGM